MAEDFQGFLDNETGENFNLQGLSRDAETGEPEVKEAARRRRKRFKVPTNSSQSQQEIHRSPRKRKIRECCFRQQEIQSIIVKVMLTGSRRNVGPIVFMLPTFFLWPGWASLLCLLGEAYMHIWSHKRNRKKKNADVEYRSPFHLISSQFCIHCRSQRLMEKIREIQDKRTLRRKIIYPNFLRRVVRREEEEFINLQYLFPLF